MIMINVIIMLLSTLTNCPHMDNEKIQNKRIEFKNYMYEWWIKAKNTKTSRLICKQQLMRKQERTFKVGSTQNWKQNKTYYYFAFETKSTKWECTVGI